MAAREVTELQDFKAELFQFLSETHVYVQTLRKYLFYSMALLIFLVFAILIVTIVLAFKDVVQITVDSNDQLS